MVQTLSALPLPLLKILLHAAKYPQSAISGVLLGSDVSGSGVTVTDAIPLFHITSALAAPVEIALAQVEAFVQQSDGKLSFVGFYQSEARQQAAELTPVGKRIADRISDKQPASIVLLLDNTKLKTFVAAEGDAIASPFELLSKDSSKGWKREGPEQLTLGGGGWQALQGAFCSAFKQQQHRGLHDFDEHLDDLSKDWLNPHISMP